MFLFIKQTHKTREVRRGITDMGCIPAETVARTMIAHDISASGYTGYPHALRLAQGLVLGQPRWCSGAAYTLVKENTR